MSHGPSEGPTLGSSPQSEGRCENIVVLLVDDDDVFRTALTELLRDDGHSVHACRSIAEVPPLESLSARCTLIADYSLGGDESGLGLAHRLEAVHPGTRVILVTAYSSDHLERVVAAARHMALLPKPVQYDELHRLVHYNDVRFDGDR